MKGTGVHYRRNLHGKYPNCCICGAETIVTEAVYKDSPANAAVRIKAYWPSGRWTRRLACKACAESGADRVVLQEATS